ncbi:MAG: efflux RND transporter periplasmic adaptor subunit [Paramuribaculum sp.]|nr:efflux RND transporter periplasmic adaptor subunit [Paramuribaculum sp.]
MKYLSHTFAILAVVLIASCSGKPEVTLETAPVTRGDVTKTITATGTVESKTQVDVGTQVTGIISELYADYNSIVKKGELIAEIEKTLLESELKSANANMESARLTDEYNKKNFERDRALHERQLISDYEFETSRKDYQVSKNAYEKSQADRVRAAKNLNYAEIYSPIDGIVISREVEVGQTVVSSMNVANLYVIADLENMRVIADVDEADIGQVKVGQEAKFTVSAYPDDVFTGTVTEVRLNPTTTNNVVTYEVVVDAHNQDMKLIPGLTAEITIYTLSEKNVLIVPQKALHFTPHEYPDSPGLPKFKDAGEATPGTRRVWVLDGDNLVATDITVGEASGSNVVVTSGLKDGETVAVSYQAAAPQDDQSGQQTQSSPFAPKPPQRKK